MTRVVLLMFTGSTKKHLPQGYLLWGGMFARMLRFDPWDITSVFASLPRGAIDVRCMGGAAYQARSPSSALCPFSGEGSPTKIDYRQELIPLF